MGLFAGIQKARIPDDERPDRKIKAIRTTHSGHKFRSRTEAKWAVFFETLQVCYTYEAAWIKLPMGRHLPDFYLPEYRAYVQVKGLTPDARALAQAIQLSEATGSWVFVVYGKCSNEDGAVMGFHKGQYVGTYSWSSILANTNAAIDAAVVAANSAVFE